jgi:uncharacterized protein (DUF1800 family)
MIHQLKHLLWRAGFGPALPTLPNWTSLPEAQWWPRLKQLSADPPEYIDVADSAIKGLLMGAGDIGRMERDELDKEQKKQLRRQSRDDLQHLNLQWLETMVYSKAQLREKMALFWHGHFASRNINILYQQQLLQIIRRHALGSFRDLLHEVSKSAAIIAFLNNQQNKKKHPNENFAREVMELFTLGRGNYTENDVKEAARAFTGWSYRLNGDFVFRTLDHDSGYKTVLGQHYRHTGEDVLNILLDQDQTARFITRKIYRFLVNEDQAPHERIEWLAARFYNSDYNILGLLDDIFTSEWFFDAENRGNKIKSPVELLVGIRRMMPLEMENPEAQLLAQKALGQILFYPPNVAGWPGGRNWIDSSSLMLRLRLPQLLAFQGELDTAGKADDDLQMGEKMPISARQRRLAARIDWAPLEAHFKNIPEQQWLAEGAALLWQHPGAPRPVLEKYLDQREPRTRLKSTWVQLMATPEFQLC